VRGGPRAAFGPDPRVPVRLPPMAAPSHDRWICAVTLGGQGRYAAAAALLGGLLADRRVPAAVAAHAAVTLASAATRSAYDPLPSVAEIALAELDDAALSDGRLGLLPLVWPARLAGADLLHERPLANEWDRAAAQESPSDTTSGSTRRRHAAERALSVIVVRMDPAGQRLIGESGWLPRPPPVE
jgi:hypothetical protein